MRVGTPGHIHHVHQASRRGVNTALRAWWTSSKSTSTESTFRTRHPPKSKIDIPVPPRICPSDPLVGGMRKEMQRTRRRPAALVKLMTVATKLGPDELLVLASLARRLRIGQKRYGRLDL